MFTIEGITNSFNQSTVSRLSDRQMVRVLTQLAHGYKDDVAARQLGVRRSVANLLRDLAAQSRCQGQR